MTTNKNFTSGKSKSESCLSWEEGTSSRGVMRAWQTGGKPKWFHSRIMDWLLQCTDSQISLQSHSAPQRNTIHLQHSLRLHFLGLYRKYFHQAHWSSFWCLYLYPREFNKTIDNKCSELNYLAKQKQHQILQTSKAWRRDSNQLSLLVTQCKNGEERKKGKLF